MANTGPDPGALLVTLTVGEVDYLISTEIVNLTHQWDAKIVSFDAPHYAIDNLHGGYCRLGLGSVELFPDLFEDNWPPPKELEIICQYTESTEALAETFFSGIIYLTGFTREGVTYAFYAENETTNLLEEGPTYHEDSLYIRDTGYKWTPSTGEEFYLEASGGGTPGIAEPERVVINGTIATKGTKGSLAVNQWVWASAGAYSTVYVRLSDGTDPDGKAVGYIRADYTDEVSPFPRAFGTVYYQPALRLPDAVTGYYRYCMGSIQGTIANCGEAGGDVWCVYDDGVDISANVSAASANVFELSSAPVGEVTISGTGEDTTLAGIFDWACGSSYLDYTLDDTYAEDPDPGVVFYATSQEVLVDFLSSLAAFFGHLFYVADDALYLVSMEEDNGTRTTDEFEFFPLSYSYQSPIKSIVANWETRTPYEGRTSGAETVVAVKDVKNEAKILTDYAYGQEINVTPYHTSKRIIEARLLNILTILQRPQVNWRIPVQGSLPVPGEKISWTDTSLVADTDCFIRCRTIKFDVNNWEVIVEGDGEVEASA